MEKYFYCAECDQYTMVEKHSQDGEKLVRQDSEWLSCHCQKTKWSSWEQGRMSELKIDERLRISPAARRRYRETLGDRVYESKMKDLGIPLDGAKSPGPGKLSDLDPAEDMARFKELECKRYFHGKLGHVYFCGCGWHGLEKEMETNAGQSIQDKSCPECHANILELDGQTYLDYVHHESEYARWCW